MRVIILVLSTMFLFTGCSSKTKKTLGLTETMPDEYQVQRNKPLEVPPHYKGAYKKAELQSKSQKASTDSALTKSEKALLDDVN
jgi:hypothetical protein